MKGTLPSCVSSKGGWWFEWSVVVLSETGGNTIRRGEVGQPPITFSTWKGERWALLSRQIVFLTQQGVAPLLHQKLLEVGHGLRILLSVSVAMWQGGWPSLPHQNVPKTCFDMSKRGPSLSRRNT